MVMADVTKKIVKKLRQYGYMNVGVVIVDSKYETWSIRCGVFVPYGYSQWNTQISNLVAGVLQENFSIGYLCYYNIIYDWRRK